MEGKSFFSWLRGRTKVVATLLFFFSAIEGVSIESIRELFSFQLFILVRLWFICAAYNFLQRRRAGIFSVELGWRMCFFNQKSHGPSDRLGFFRTRQCPWSVWWVCCCLCWVPWSPNLKRNQISEAYDVTAYHCAWNLGDFQKKQRHPAIGHVAFGMGVLLKFWKVPSWQVGACHQEAGGSWIERTRKTFMSCLRVWVS